MSRPARRSNFALVTDERARPGLSKLIVGYDSRPEGRDAVELGRRIAEMTGASLSLVTVTTERSGSLERKADEDPFAPLLDQLGDCPVESLILRDKSPAEALVDLAGKQEADLIVVGSTHRGALRRVLPGSTAQQMLTTAGCPIAVAPRGLSKPQSGADSRIRVIAVAYDGSPESTAALQLATDIAWEERATLRVMTVNPPIRASAYAAPAAPKTIRQGFSDSLQEALAALPDELHPLGQMLNGEPAEVLLEQLELGVDLLVMGSQGRGSLRRAVLGSVASRVLSRASCPVIVVPPGAASVGKA